MLKRVKNQEKVIIMFFLIVLFLVGLYVIFEKNIIDIFYFIGMLFFFVRFLMIKKNGR